MGIFMDGVYSLLFGGVYGIFVYKLAQVMFRGRKAVENEQKMLMFLFIVGVAGVILTRVMTIQSKYIRSGFIVGSIILIGLPILTGWSSLSDEIKLFIVGVGLASLLYYYSGDKKNDG